MTRADHLDWRDALIAREPVFDHPEFIWDEQSFDREISPDFFEIGASGARYEREAIREVVLDDWPGPTPSHW